MITDVEDYFAKGCGRCDRFATSACSVQAWARELAELRRLCREAGLEEAVRYGHPCYRHAGRNIAILGAFRGNVRLSFFGAALLSDPAGVLERQGPNTRHPDMIRFDGTVPVADRAPVVLAYLREAMAHAEQGLRPPAENPDLDIPDELVAALDDDPELAEAFQALTPGRQRSYVIALSSAKSSATRSARVARFRPRILAGKGAQER